MFKPTVPNKYYNNMTTQSTKDERKGRFSRFLEKRKEEKSVPGPRPAPTNNFNSDSAYASSENDPRKDTPDPDFVRVQDHHLPGVSQDKSLWLDKNNGEIYDEDTGDVVTTVTTTTTTTTTTTSRGGRKQEVIDVQTTQGEPRSHSIGRSGTTSGTLGLNARDAGGLNEMPAGATHISHTTSGTPSTSGVGATSYTAPNTTGHTTGVHNPLGHNTTGSTTNPLNTTGNNTAYNTNERNTFGDTSGHHGIGHNNTGLSTNERSNFGNTSSHTPGQTGTGSVLHNTTAPNRTGTTLGQGSTGNTTTLPDRTGHSTFGDSSGRNTLGNTTGLNANDRSNYGDTTGTNNPNYSNTGNVPTRHDSSPPIPSRNPGRRSGEWSQNDMSDYDRDHASAVSPIQSNQHNFSYPSRATPTGGVADNVSARSSGSTLANLKAAAIAAHGIGETLRGTLNNAVDSRYSRGNAEKAAAVNQKNQATLERGRNELERFNTGSTFRSNQGNTTGSGYDGPTRENTTSSAYNPAHGNTVGSGYNDRPNDSVVGAGNNNLNRNDTLGYDNRNNNSTIGTGNNLNRNDTIGANYNDSSNTNTLAGRNNNTTSNPITSHLGNNQSSTSGTGYNDPLRSHAPTSANPLTSGTTNTNTADYHPPSGTMVGNNSATTNNDNPDYVAGRDYSSGTKSSGGLGKLFKRKPLNETETRSQGQNQQNRYF